MKRDLHKFSLGAFLQERGIRKSFFIEKSREILAEHAEISAKNKVDRENLLASRTDFQKKFADAQSDIQTAREAIQKTMR